MVAPSRRRDGRGEQAAAPAAREEKEGAEHEGKDEGAHSAKTEGARADADARWARRMVRALVRALIKMRGLYRKRCNKNMWRPRGRDSTRVQYLTVLIYILL